MWCSFESSSHNCFSADDGLINWFCSLNGLWHKETLQLLPNDGVWCHILACGVVFVYYGKTAVLNYNLHIHKLTVYTLHALYLLLSCYFHFIFHIDILYW